MEKIFKPKSKKEVYDTIVNLIPERRREGKLEEILFLGAKAGQIEIVKLVINDVNLKLFGLRALKYSKKPHVYKYIKRKTKAYKPKSKYTTATWELGINGIRGMTIRGCITGCITT